MTVYMSDRDERLLREAREQAARELAAHAKPEPVSESENDRIWREVVNIAGGAA